MNRSLSYVLLAGALILAALAGFSALSPARASAPGAVVELPHSTTASLPIAAWQDSYVDEGSPSSNFGGDTLLFVGSQFGQTGATVFSKALIQFDLASLPPGAAVTKATLQLLQIESSTGAPDPIFVDAITRPWSEATVTAASIPTSAAQGDPSTSVDNTTGVKYWDVTTTVQNWASGKLANDGFLLYLTSRPTAVHVFSSSEGQTAPLLTVEYSLPPSDTPTATATATSTRTATPTNTATATPTKTTTPTATATAVQGRADPDLGDAPDSANHLGAVMEAYPGVSAGFPTVYDRGSSAPHGPLHANQPLLFRLGQAITAESEADQGPDADVINNIIPAQNSPDHDKADDGLTLPSGFVDCQPVQLSFSVTSPAATRAFVNVWVDWNRNGKWGDVPICPASGQAAPEWAVQNQTISLSGGSQNFVTTAFLPYNADPGKDAWLRISVSDTQAPAADGSGPAGGYASGETEDYLLRGMPAPTRTPAPTWTPIPSPTPTIGPSPTPKPAVPVYSYLPPVKFVLQAVTPDLSFYGIEITEGIQCFDTTKGLAACPDNSLLLVTRKDTTARIYLKYAGPLANMIGVPVRLHLFANGVEYIANSTGTAVKTLNQGANDDARVYFNVDFGVDMPVSYYAEVDPDHLISESNEANNRYPTSGTLTLTFHKGRDGLNVVGRRLHYHPAGYSGTQDAGGWAVNGGGANWWEQVLPLRDNGIHYSLASGTMDWTTNLATGDGQHALIAALNNQWIMQNLFAWLFGTGAFTGARHVYGWAPNAGYSGGHADMPIYPHAGGLGVVGIGTDAPGTSTDQPGAGALIFGHELTHDYNVYHTNTADACGSNDGNSNFPYGSSSIQEFGFNPITGKIYDPATTHDLMSYCPSAGTKQGWISPFTWNQMVSDLGTAAANTSARRVQVGTLSPSASADSIAVNVTVYNPDVPNSGGGKLGQLGELYRVATGVVYPPIDGDYAVQLRYGDAILASQTFTVSFQSEYSAHTGDTPGDPTPSSQADMSFIMPWAEGATSVVLLHNDAVLDQRSVSAHAPTVTITGPTGPADWPAGTTQTLSWSGSDLDQDPLKYAVFYSHDAGATWQLLANELAATSMPLQVDSLAGGSDVRFRVVASDGILTGYAETPAAISVPNKAPIPLITNPVTGEAHQPGSLIVFKGLATDLEDGGLPDAALQWSDSVQGGLGTGPTVPIDSLKPGWHTVTLAVSDSNGQVASAEVQVFVGDRAFLPLILR